MKEGNLKVLKDSFSREPTHDELLEFSAFQMAREICEDFSYQSLAENLIKGKKPLTLMGVEKRLASEESSDSVISNWCWRAKNWLPLEDHSE